jgi:voltage-gated potassium channel
MTAGYKWLKWIIEYRFVSIVLFLLVQNLLYIAYTSMGFSGENLFGSAFLTLTMIFCALAVSKDKRSFRIGLVWGGLSIISVWASIFLDFRPLGLIYLFFILYTTVVIIYNVIISKEININVIFGSIAGFLLMGVVGAAICMTLETSIPGSFTMAEGLGKTPPTFYYFSIITMTSLGYGDITPATDIARAISVYLVLFGQFYLAIQVAILVGKFIMRADSKQKEKEIEDLKKELLSLKKDKSE